MHACNFVLVDQNGVSKHVSWLENCFHIQDFEFTDIYRAASTTSFISTRQDHRRAEPIESNDISVNDYEVGEYDHEWLKDQR